MRGIIILAHGSRRNESDIILEALRQKVIDKTGEKFVYSAFLQFSGQDLEGAVKKLISDGVQEIIIVPMFIFDGIHVTKDIPEELELLRKKYPNLNFTLTKHLGDDDRIAEIIEDRINGK